jgi:hypothetical protein
MEFVLYAGINQHIKDHHFRPVKFACDICKEEFSTKTLLIRHFEHHFDKSVLNVEYDEKSATPDSEDTNEFEPPKKKKKKNMRMRQYYYKSDDGRYIRYL